MISQPGEGETHHFEPGSLVRFKVLSASTGDQFEMYEREVPPHTIGADPHMHHHLIETFYVIEGQVTILCGETRAVYGPGATVVVPKETSHGFWNESDQPIKLLITFVPGLRHNEFFRELAVLKAGPRAEYAPKLAALRERFDATTLTED